MQNWVLPKKSNHQIFSLMNYDLNLRVTYCNHTALSPKAEQRPEGIVIIIIIISIANSEIAP